MTDFSVLPDLSDGIYIESNLIDSIVKKHFSHIEEKYHYENAKRYVM